MDKIKEAFEIWETEPWSPEFRKILDESIDYKSAWVEVAFYGGYLAAEAAHKEEKKALVSALQEALGWIETYHVQHDHRKSFGERWRGEIELGMGYERDNR